MPKVAPAVTLKFQPSVGQKYYTINGQDLVCSRVWNNHKEDKTRARHGNVYQTVGAAKKVRDQIQSLRVASQS